MVFSKIRFYSIMAAPALKWGVVSAAILALAGCGGGGGRLDNGEQSTTTTESTSGRYAVVLTVVGSGEVTLAPTGDDCGSNCYMYDKDASVQLTAVADTGNVFISWEGTCVFNVNPCTVEMTDDIGLVVNFDAAATKQAKQGVWNEMVWQ
ncbi:hypothetical protein ACFL2V_02345 [Pseudomonadota bacterium]